MTRYAGQVTFGTLGDQSDHGKLKEAGLHVHPGYTSTGALMWVGYGVGAIMVLTSLVGFCPLYLPLKLSTLKK